MSWENVVYLTLGAVIVAVELLGVWRRKTGDTISEMYWWLQRHAWWVRMPMGGFLVWLFVHFLFEV